MAPRLLRFYGGSAAEWLSTPFGAARRFLRAIAPLRAEEALEASAVAMVGHQLELEDPTALRQAWRRGMGLQDPASPQATPAKSARENVADTVRRFAASGIPVAVEAHG